MIEKLIACAGQWRGINRVIVEPTSPLETSNTTVLVTPILKGTFVRIDQKWDWQGDPQEGSFIIGFGDKPGEASVHWLDTWHNGIRVMHCIGTFETDGAINTLGSWPYPPGPDWGWRIVIKTPSTNELEIIMTNISPDGNEEGGVETMLSRACLK